MQFYQLARGARFEYKGKKWIETAMAMADQEDSNEGFVIWGSTEVTPLDGAPQELSKIHSGLSAPLKFRVEALIFQGCKSNFTSSGTWSAV